jgi:hypothetical protein
MLARLLVFGALMTSLIHSETLAQAQADGRTKPPRESRKGVVSLAPVAKTVTGEFTATKEGAIQSALRKAREEVAKTLKRPVDQIPDVEYLRQHCLTGLEDEEDEKWKEEAIDNKRVLVLHDNFPGAEVVKDAYQVRLRVELTEKDFAEITKKTEQVREEARREIVQQRQSWLAKVLLGVVVFLGSLSGYIRLEDATKGYYTGWLRLGLVGVLCAVGAGLWLVS